jgi:hypothetical protein
VVLQTKMRGMNPETGAEIYDKVEFEKELGNER